MRALTMLLLCSAVVFAACVNGHPTVQKEYKSSELVFIGKVIAQHKTPASGDGYFLDGDVYTVVPIHIFSGGAEKDVGLFSENSSGRFPMELGQEYLLFVYSDHDRLLVDNCGSSGLSSRTKNAQAVVARLSGQH